VNATNINGLVTRLEQGMGAEHVRSIYGRLRPVSAAQRLAAMAFQIGRNSALEAAVEIALTARLEKLAPPPQPLPVAFEPSLSGAVAIRPARPQIGT
jgi:hypothetical protein